MPPAGDVPPQPPSVARASDPFPPSAPTPRWRWLLFDLDGTLTDPAQGITGSITHALRARGYPAPAPESLSWVVGPPLRGTFERLAGTADKGEIDALIAAYRERFVPVGMYENSVYAGIPECLVACTAAGCTMALATLKPSVFARRILRHFGMGSHFSAIVGSYLDGRRDDKAKVIRRALTVLGADPARTVMIGDRAADVAGARACGVAAIGAGWGYGDPGELAAEDPLAIVSDADELRSMLLGP